MSDLDLLKELYPDVEFSDIPQDKSPDITVRPDIPEASVGGVGPNVQQPDAPVVFKPMGEDTSFQDFLKENQSRTAAEKAASNLAFPAGARPIDVEADTQFENDSRIMLENQLFNNTGQMWALDSEFTLPSLALEEGFFNNSPDQVIRKLHTQYPELEYAYSPFTEGQVLYGVRPKGSSERFKPINKPGLSKADLLEFAGALPQDVATTVPAIKVLSGANRVLKFVGTPFIDAISTFGWRMGTEEIDRQRGYNKDTREQSADAAGNEAMLSLFSSLAPETALRTYDVATKRAGVFSGNILQQSKLDLVDRLRDRGYTVESLTPRNLGGTMGKVQKFMEQTMTPQIGPRQAESVTEAAYKLFLDAKADPNLMDAEGFDVLLKQAELAQAKEFGLDIGDAETAGGPFAFQATEREFGTKMQKEMNTFLKEEMPKEFDSRYNSFYTTGTGFSVNNDPAVKMARELDTLFLEFERDFSDEGIERIIAKNPQFKDMPVEEIMAELGNVQFNFSISPELKNIMSKVAEMTPDTIGTMVGGDALKRTHELRKMVDLIAFDETQSKTTRYVARNLRNALSESLESATTSNPALQKEWLKLNADYKEFVEFKERDFILKLAESETPSTLAQEVVGLNAVAKDRFEALGYYFKAHPEKKAEFTNAFRVEMMKNPEAILSLNFGIDSNTTRMATEMLGGKEGVRTFSNYARLHRALKSSSTEASLNKMKTTVERAKDLAKNMGEGEFLTLLESGGEPFRKTLVMGMYADLLDRSVANEITEFVTKDGTKKAVNLVDPQVFAKNLSEYQSTPLWKSLTPDERKVLEDWQSYSIAIKDPSAGGASIAMYSLASGLTPTAILMDPLNALTQAAHLFTMPQQARWLASDGAMRILYGANVNKKSFYDSDPIRGVTHTGWKALNSFLNVTESYDETKVPDFVKKVPIDKGITESDFNEFLKENPDIEVKFTPLSSTYYEDTPAMSEEDAIISNELTGGSTLKPKGEYRDTSKITDWDEIISNELTGPSTVVPMGGSSSNKFLDMQSVFDKERLFNQGIPVDPKLGTKILETSPELGEYMIKSMKLESAGGKLLKGSVADGYFQFVEDTWPSYAAKAGVKAKSAKTASLTEQVKVMEEFTKANAERLRPFLGRDPSQGELYLAHHFGAGGAKTLVRAADKSPNSLAKNFVSPKAFKHNKSLIGNKTVSELIQYLDLSFEKGKFSKNHSLERQMAALR